MKYAQYISETTINTTLPKKGYDAQGHIVIGNLENRPDVLELLKFYPLVEEPMPSEAIEGEHYEKRYRLDSEVIEPEESPTEEEVNDGPQDEPTEEEGQAGMAPRDDDDQPIDPDEPGEGEPDPVVDPEPEPEPEPPQPTVKYTVVQYWVSVEDPPAPPEPIKVYSKLKILMAADEAGFADALMDMIEADRKTKYIWDASNTIEDNALLQAYLPGIAQALGKTVEELKAFLDQYCVAE